MRPVPSLLAAILLAGGLAAAEGKHGVDYAVIATERLRILVPADAADALRPFAARADALYAHLAADAGYVIREPLTLWMSDDVDSHNGFSTVVPRPLVNVQLAPTLPESFIFAGADELERTLVHELAHHISNDRNPLGFRRALERAFGRVVPFDPLSLAIFYLSTPAHIGQPLFWQEGLAQWCETAYADPASAWGGRGRDSLTHMVWRLDAAAGGIPPVDEWRASWPRWPYGNRIYLYGIAYTRWLEAAYGRRVPLWSLIEHQGHNWFLHFSSGSQNILGVDHAALIERARRDLLAEQNAALAVLRSQRVTAAARLTEPDATVAAPAWLPDGRLLFAWNGRFARPEQATLDAEGRQRSSGRTAWAMGGVRTLPDGTAVYAEADGSDDPWERSRVRIVPPGTQTALVLAGERLVQPDLRRSGDGFAAAAVQLLPAGRTALVVSRGRMERRLLGWRVDNGAWTPLPVQGRPWSPAFRPGGDELAWVETDAAGSRLVLAPVAEPDRRRVLWTVRGRLMHPAWSADGRHLYVCSDHTGVANAWRLDAAAEAAAPTPVTNTIGGVIACVPAPNGRALAIVDHDARGPFIARIAADPAAWPAAAPELALRWPAPVAADAAPLPPRPRPGAESVAANQARPLPPADPAAGAAAEIAPYAGLTRVRPLFWTPTTIATPAGGVGAVGVAADPLFHHVVQAGGGFGVEQGTPVGYAGYAWTPELIDVQGSVWRVERAYADRVVTSDFASHPYVEQAQGAALAIGTGLAGLSRRWQTSLTAGLERSKPVPVQYGDRQVISGGQWQGVERFVEAGIAYDDSQFYPTSYAREDGDAFALRYRRSGFGGELDGDSAYATGTKVVSVWPRLGHQLVLAGIAGWSGGQVRPQGRFTVGGASGIGLPRGYLDAMDSGDFVLAWSAAYRFSLWPAFTWFGTTPLGFRQLVGEVFYDAAQASDDRIGGHGPWFRSAGGELRGEWEFYLIRAAPGVGAAHLFQKRGEIAPYITLGFAY